MAGAKRDTGEVSTLTVDSQTVNLTRLDKVLFPAAKFIKAQLIDYYVRVAPFLLPHLRNRPVTLKRYPDGVSAEAYWDKDAPSFTPEWVETVAVPRRAGGPDIRYIVINNTATLAWTANIAAIELHPFLHCARDVTSPVAMVFDLDPGPGADLLSCIEIALRLRDMLERLHLRSFPKVSGSKGLQVYVPLNTPASYRTTQPFARAIAEMIERERPDLAVAAMPKHLRTRKVFIDWSQNADYKTTVGVYSMRAKRTTPFVSMPVTWDELAAALQARSRSDLYFHPPQALARLERVGDLFAEVLTLQQTLPIPVEAPPPARTAIRRETRATVARRSKQGGQRRFAVRKQGDQYVLSLEIGDGLKSWTIRGGIPSEPHKTRRAIAGEDQPRSVLDAANWDTGTYEIVEGTYAKGMLNIGLAGRKLSGEYLLRAGSRPAHWVIERLSPASLSRNRRRSA